MFSEFEQTPEVKNQPLPNFLLEEEEETEKKKNQSTTTIKEEEELTEFDFFAMENQQAFTPQYISPQPFDASSPQGNIHKDLFRNQILRIDNETPQTPRSLKPKWQNQEGKTTTRTTKKRLTAQEIKQEDIPVTRVWTTNRTTLIREAEIKVQMKTRYEKFLPVVSTKFYSTLNYQIKVECRIPDVMVNIIEQPFLSARVVILNEKNEVVETDYKNLPTVTGEVETSLKKQHLSNETLFTGLLKVRVGDLSYHHKKKFYRFALRIFSSKNVDEMIHESVTPTFCVFARKPNKPRKRSSKIEEDLSDTRPKKKKMTLTDFDDKLNAALLTLDSLPEEVKETLKENFIKTIVKSLTEQ